MNRTVLATLVLVVVLAGGWWFFHDNGEGNRTISDEPSSPVSSIPIPALLVPPQPALPISPVDPTSTPSLTPVAPEPAPPQDIPPVTKTVRYTESGYEPQTIEINPGDTVVFKNESTDTVWTASNPHPTHTTNAAFDELKASNTGETYSFIFNQAGTWRYHNHLNPGHTGSVIVK